MFISLNQGRAEAPLEYVPNAIMSMVEALGIDPVDLSHSTGEIRIPRPDDEVVVVGHQTVGEALPREAREGFHDYIEEDLVIPVVQEDRLLRVATGEHVVGAAR